MCQIWFVAGEAPIVYQRGVWSGAHCGAEIVLSLGRDMCKRPEVKQGMGIGEMGGTVKLLKPSERKENSNKQNNAIFANIEFGRKKPKYNNGRTGDDSFTFQTFV
jgi:hypothetical protein